LLFKEFDAQLSPVYEPLKEHEICGFYNDFASLLDSLLELHLKTNKLDDLASLIMRGRVINNDKGKLNKSSKYAQESPWQVDDDSAFMMFIRSCKSPVISKVVGVISSIVNIRSQSNLHRSIPEIEAINNVDSNGFDFLWNMAL
jgi:hypothetical protein